MLIETSNRHIREESTSFHRYLINEIDWRDRLVCFKSDFETVKDKYANLRNFVAGVVNRKDGVWYLAPAYDLTFSYDERSRWISGHQMTIAMKRNDITIDDIMSASKVAGLKPSRAHEIVEEVRSAIVKWPEYAEKAQVDDLQHNLIWQKLKSQVR